MQQTVWDVVTQQSYYTLVLSTGPPFITVQPQDVAVYAGLTATFTVGAGGALPMSYQWFKNNSAIGGATNGSYTTPLTTTNDNGAVFSVAVFNSVNTVTSSNAVLTVNVNPASLASLIFQADFNGPGTGTGGTNDLVAFGGTGALGSITGGSIAIQTTNSIAPGAGGYLFTTESNTFPARPAICTFTPNTASNSLNAFYGGVINTNTVINGAFDLFVRNDSTTNTVNDRGYSAFFRPLDSDSRGSVANAGGLRIIMQGTTVGTTNGGQIQWQLIASANTRGGVNAFSGVTYAKGVGDPGPSPTQTLGTGGTISLITSGYGGSGIRIGSINHIGFTFNTDTNGLVTFRAFGNTNAAALDTSSSSPNLLLTSTFYVNGAISNQLFAAANTTWSMQESVSGTGTKSYDCVRLFNSDPGSFSALVVPAQFVSAVANANGTVTLTWSGSGTLQWAPTVQGAWTSLPLAVSPYTESLVPTNRFFRFQ
jgi:hypothetical protein